jgi:hypothetical protein
VFEVCRTSLLENGKEKILLIDRDCRLSFWFSMYAFLFGQESCKGFSLKVLQKGFEVHFAYVIR